MRRLTRALLGLLFGAALALAAGFLLLGEMLRSLSPHA